MFRTYIVDTARKHKITTWIVFSLLGFATFCAIICAVVTKSDTKMKTNTNNLVSGIYFSNWSVYGPKHFPHDLDVDNLSHVFYAFMKIDGNTGNVALSDEWADVQLPMDNAKGALGAFAILKKKNRSLKLVMSIGGWGTAQQFIQVTSDEEKLTKFVDSALGLLKDHHFDGIDIDWEYPANSTEGAQLVKLLSLLRSGMNQIRRELILTFASPASEEHCQHLNFSEMDKLLTYWNIMAYDFAGSGWSSKTAYHSNLYGGNGDNHLNADSVMKYYADRVDRRKILMGMPMYGRRFQSPKAPQIGQSFSREFRTGSDTIDFCDITKADEVFDEKHVAAYGYNQEDDVFTTYDNPRSASTKAKYIIDNGYGGGFWWDSKGESKEKDRKLVSTFVETLGGPDALDGSENWI